MFDDFNICPYTGLRSFTEEESIYFKGRDEHIKEATAQLEKNKFLMLTGASGDGKSSLVYAGIIPNARSGFLKATYSNWQVIDFRPERSPLQNLCKSVARGLNIDNTETIKAELEHGFSALIDLYRSSKRYIDESTNEWKDANEKERAALTRDASNLIILADQFEEFFTNPENYHGGAPSVEASLVLNLLLETARIALEENLPIYVVFTMRSDYIGQCAAFRGLPEYIGFSQFFVPRMNRKQLQEVIEEPAVLSGNKITRRLTERLIEDITDGTDQLPMLQHGLNQIWKMADSGKEEMDLIHYAMVGGIADDQLPDEDQQKFIDWFNEQPKKIQICYDKASLQNVLNTHANKLNNHAADYVANHSQISVDEEDAKLIIESTFKCLTKINEGRAVRNRMTLAEITQIINKPGIDTKTVNSVLNVYRDHTNTLLKPFIGEENEEWEIEEDEVLDITHESLIRNWTRLDEWAKSEVDDYTIYLDFNKQLQRWIENDHSSDFLLSIGQLTYFETWFNKKEPNEYWIARYESDTASSKLESAAKVLAEAKAFLKSSARSHIVTRTVMRYGPKRIAAVIGVIVFLILSSFTIKTYLDRTDSSMRKFLVEEMNRYANDSTIAPLNVSAANIEQLRLKDITPDELVNRIISTKRKVDVINNTVSWMIISAPANSSPEIFRLLEISDSLINQEFIKESSRDIAFLLKESNDLGAILDILYYFAPDDQLALIFQKNSKRIASIVNQIINNSETNFGSTNQLNTGIESALNSKTLSNEDIGNILSKISPFEVEYESSNWLKEKYKRSEIYEIGFGNLGSNYHGLYQEVAYLYAAIGNTDRALQATDSLLFYNNKYANESYFDNANNGINIADYFNRYGHSVGYKEYIDAYCNKEKISLVKYYQLLQARSKVSIFTTLKLSTEGNGFINKYYNSNIDFIDSQSIRRIASEYRDAITNSILDEQEKTFLLAESYKREGLKLAYIINNDSLTRQNDLINSLFKRSFELYSTLPDEFINIVIPSVASTSSNSTTITRKQLFLYPDKVETFYDFVNFFDFRYSSPAFLDYVIRNNLIVDYYSNDIDLIDDWFTEYTSAFSVIGFRDVKEISYDFDKYLLEAINGLEVESKKHLSLLYLTLGNHASANEDLKMAQNYYKKVSVDDLINKLQFFGIFNEYVLFNISNAIKDLYRYEDIDAANKFLDGFNNPINRSSLYAMAAKEAIINHGKFPYVDQLIDSSYAEMDRVENTDNQPNKNLIAAALAFRNKGNDIDEAIKVIKNERRKANGIWWISRGLAFNKDLYMSHDVIPDNLSEDDICGYLYEVYHDYERNNRPESAYWKKWNRTGDNNDKRIDYIR